MYIYISVIYIYIYMYSDTNSKKQVAKYNQCWFIYLKAILIYI